MEIKDKVIPDQKLAVINYKGPIADMDVLIAKLMGWVESEDVETNNPPFIIYYSNRFSYDPEEVVFDVGVPISNDAEGTELINIVDMLEHTVLSSTHYGSYENIKDSYEKMVDYTEEKNYDIIGSPKEVLVQNRFEIDDDNDLVTEIQLPIIKMFD
ncbi:MAG: GyrI-like domain-containing protein [Methanobacteriaceae archaeon]|jgi:effector-binding domain-containing protein|nr:GyrI-like domain-containing protein [Methanobacteriaceae archaeon]